MPADGVSDPHPSSEILDRSVVIVRIEYMIKIKYVLIIKNVNQNTVNKSDLVVQIDPPLQPRINDNDHKICSDDFNLDTA